MPKFLGLEGVETATITRRHAFGRSKVPIRVTFPAICFCKNEPNDPHREARASSRNMRVPKIGSKELNPYPKYLSMFNYAQPAAVES